MYSRARASSTGDIFPETVQQKWIGMNEAISQSGRSARHRNSEGREPDLRAEVHMRHLPYFIVAAKEQNFNKAAAQLNMSQSAISRRIDDLEQALGAELFVRSRKSVRLSLAGKSLLSDAQRVLSNFSHAAARCRSISRSERNELKIGINDSALRHMILGRAFQDFRKTFPQVNLRMEQTAPTPLIEAIASGLVDGAFIYTRPRGDPIFDAVEVAHDTFLLAVPQNHRLAGSGSVRLRDLSDEEFLWLPRESAPDLHDCLLEACKSADLDPVIGQTILSESTRLHLVSKGLGISFVTTSFATMQNENVTLLPVADLNVDLILEFVWRQDSATAFTRSFADIVLQCKMEIQRNQMSQKFTNGAA